ncbi:hypothetical protein [Fodinibius sp.]|uniref:hypothetical protein n=1 Tax=Fodinibius sp. TaxID=1872440 RepID=UPI0035634320
MSFYPGRILLARYSLLVFTLVIILSSLNITDSFGQQTNANDNARYWVHGGTSVSNLGLGIHGGLSVDYKQHVFSLRTTSTDMSYGAETWDVALLYGRSTTFRTWYFSAGVGAAVIGGEKYPGLFGRGNSSPMETMLGFPLEAVVSWQPVNVVALGLYGFANVNTEHPIGGMGLSFRIGDLY